MTGTRIPEGALLNKLKAIETHFGMDKLSDKLLFKIARHAIPRRRRHLDRYVAILLIFTQKLPIPVTTSPPQKAVVESKG